MKELIFELPPLPFTKPFPGELVAPLTKPLPGTTADPEGGGRGGKLVGLPPPGPKNIPHKTWAKTLFVESGEVIASSPAVNEKT